MNQITPDLTDRVITELRIAFARERIPQAEVARRLGKNYDWITRRMAGETPITLDDLEQITGVVGIDLAELLAAAS